MTMTERECFTPEELHDFDEYDRLILELDSEEFIIDSDYDDDDEKEVVTSSTVNVAVRYMEKGQCKGIYFTSWKDYEDWKEANTFPIVGLDWFDDDLPF